MIEEEFIEHLISAKRDSKSGAILTGVVLEPNPSNGLTEKVIELSAHGWMEAGCPFDRGTPLESYIAPTDINSGGAAIKKGSWVLVVREDDAP